MTSTEVPLHLLERIRCVSTARVIYGVIGLLCVGKTASVEEITEMDDDSHSTQAAMV